MALISTLQLGWSDLGGFTAQGSPVAQSITNGVLSTTVRASGGAPYDGIISTAAYDWRGATLTWELASVGAGQPLVRVGGYGVNNSPAIIHLQDGRTFYGATDVNGEFASLGSTRTGNFRFARISVSADGAAGFFELSTDGVTWGEWWNGWSPPAGMSSCKLMIFGDPTAGSPTYVINRVNAAAVAPAPSTLFRPYFITG